MANTINFRRAYSIAVKEVRHIVRDPFTLGLALGLPMIMVLFFGYAMDFNVHDIHITIYDQDKSRASRQLAELFQCSGYFKVYLENLPANPAKSLDSQEAKAALFIEPNFGRDLAKKGTATAQVLVDGSDNSTAGIIGGYLNGIQLAATERLAGKKMRPPIQVQTRYLFNPELNSRWFTVPGLSVVVLAILAIMLTAITVAREWENGSMELLLSTPVHPLEIIMGKLAPYLALGLIAQALIYLAGRLLFGVPFVGSNLLLLLGTMLFLAAGMALGLFISVTTRHQLTAIQFSLIAGMLPSLLLSGFIFPIENMNTFFRCFTMIFPARWFMQVMRGLFLRGNSLADLAVPLLVLFFMDVVFITVATRKFKKDVEP